MARDRHWLRLIENGHDLDGAPSDALVAELGRSFHHTRQAAKRQRVLLAVAITLLAVTSIAVGFAVESTRQKKIAEENLKVARETADGVVAEVVRGLRDVEGMRTEATSKILAHTEKALAKLAQSGSHDSETARSQAKMYNEFVDTYIKAGDTAGAVRTANMAVETMRVVGASRYATAEDRSLLSLSLVKLGDAQDEIGRHEAARKAHTEALTIRQALADESPMDDKRQRDVGVSLSRLGALLQSRGDIQSAREAFERSRVIRRKLVPRHPEWRRDLIVTEVQLSDIHHALRDYQVALNLAQEAEQLAQVLVSEDLVNTRYLRDLANSQQRIGNALAAKSEFPAARQAYMTSRDTYSRLSEIDQDNIEAKRDVAVSGMKLAAVARESDDVVSARVEYDDTINQMRVLLQRSPNNKLFMEDLAEALYWSAFIHESKERFTRFEESGRLLNELKKRGALGAEQAVWLSDIENSNRKVSEP
jgi:tetratricopeptide (TPR) repeat protein